MPDEELTRYVPKSTFYETKRLDDVFNFETYLSDFHANPCIIAKHACLKSRIG